MEDNLLDPEVIISFVDVGDVLLLHAMPVERDLHGASVCCAMIGFAAGTCVSICL
jgi:hypothetical protein